MANQSASPREAQVARRLLAELDAAERANGLFEPDIVVGMRDLDLNAAIDDFLRKHVDPANEMSIEYRAEGTRINLDGPAASQPGALGAMLRTALAHQRQREKSLLEDG